MNIRRYLELLAYIGYIGRPLKEVEDEFHKRWGVSRKMVWVYIQHLKREGLVRNKRETWREGRRWRSKIWVEPTPELKRIMAEVEANFYPSMMRRYLRKKE